MADDVHTGHSQDELEALLRIARALSSSLELHRVMQIAIDGALELLSLDTGAIYLVEDETLELQAASPPLPARFPEEVLTASLENHPHIREFVRSAEPRVILDTTTEEFTPEERLVVEARDLRSLLYAPLMYQGKAIGIFIVGSSAGPREFDDRDTALAQTLAHQIALAVNNALLYSKLEASGQDV